MSTYTIVVIMYYSIGNLPVQLHSRDIEHPPDTATDRPLPNYGMQRCSALIRLIADVTPEGRVVLSKHCC